jgi:predicted small lipoprotein YifL
VRRIFTSLALAAAIAALTTACSQKGPAEEALKAADAAVTAAKGSVEKFVPDQWKALNDSLKDAKDKFGKGDYPAALTAAQAIAPKAQDAIKAAAAKKEEFTKTWTDLSGSVPNALKATEDKVGALAAMKKLPKGIDKAKVEAAQANLADTKKTWDEATAAAKAGDVTTAVAKAKPLKEKAADIDKSLEPAAPAPAAAPTPKKKKK